MCLLCLTKLEPTESKLFCPSKLLLLYQAKKVCRGQKFDVSLQDRTLKTHNG